MLLDMGLCCNIIFVGLGFLFAEYMGDVGFHGTAMNVDGQAQA